MVYFLLIAVPILIAALIVAFRFDLHFTVLIGAVVVALLGGSGAYGITSNAMQSDDQTFYQFYNGYETSATSKKVECTRDGSCYHDYDCDPYTEIYYVTVADDDGEGTHEELRTRTVYHSCPYSTEETSYYVDTTLGSYTFASHVMTGNEWRSGKRIPGGQVKKAPKDWTAVKKRLEKGTPGPVSQIHSYENYILASDASLFKKYSDDIEFYKDKNLLPSPADSIQGHYTAIKAYFAGKVTGLDRKELTKDVSYLSGAVGTALQGDVHVVFVDSSDVKVGRDYANALLAYWTNVEGVGKHTLAKNAILVVVGVNDSSVTSAPTAKWVEAATGMPVGNEGMLQQIKSDLTGKPIDANFIGKPSYDVNTKEIKRTDGLLESVIFGVNKFERVSMSGDDKDDHGSGFKYLKAEWKPDTGQQIWLYIITSLITLILLAIGVFVSYTATGYEMYDPAKVLFSKKNV